MVGSCSTTQTPLHSFSIEGHVQSEKVVLTGWLGTKGELRLFASERAMHEDAKYPQCISGVSMNHSSQKFSQWNKKHVRLEATIWDYDTLPFESDYELARKVLGNSIITNWCWGPKVLLVSKVEALSH